MDKFGAESGIQRLSELLALPGRVLFSLAFFSLGIETLVCAHVSQESLGPGYMAIPALPWVPAIAWVGWIFGAFWILCAVGIVAGRWRCKAAMALGAVLMVCTVILIAPKYAGNLGNMGVRTVFFEPLTLACIALLLPGVNVVSVWLARVCRFLIAVSLIVFGVDHFLALGFIASLLPAWIPGHEFWVIFFGVALIAGGLGFFLGILYRWATLGLGLLFGIWVTTLHLPRVFGLYGIAGAPTNPNEWSSCFIALGLWGGFWALGTAPENLWKRLKLSDESH